MAPLLEVSGLTKRFGAVTALSGVEFELEAGEIHALCGENGAGKSTLIKCLSGVYAHGSFDGEIRLDGRVAAFQNPAHAEASGIAVIHQELSLFRELSVAENLFMGRHPQRLGLVDWNRLLGDARTLLGRFGLDVDPAAQVGDLSIGRQQMVEIAKALGKSSRILFLDEPSAALTDSETRVLIAILKRLRERGLACVYISHRLEEVRELGDRVTVLRDGRSVGTLARDLVDKNEIIRRMVGRDLGQLFPRRRSHPGEPLLEVKELEVAEREGKRPKLSGITCAVRAGEVLGIGGLMGAGRTELVTHLAGAWGRRCSGEVRLEGRPFEPANPRDALRLGVALVSEDRKRHGLVLDQSVGFNISLASLARFSRRGLLDQNAESNANRELCNTLRIKTDSLEAQVNNLSGGNQQKVVLAKVLMTGPHVVLLDEPTRGIDVGAKVEVYELINRLTAEGKAVVMVTSELPELLGMSDRILMLSEGRMGGIFDTDAATPELLLQAAMRNHARLEFRP